MIPKDRSSGGIRYTASAELKTSISNPSFPLSTKKECTRKVQKCRKSAAMGRRRSKSVVHSWGWPMGHTSRNEEKILPKHYTSTPFCVGKSIGSVCSCAPAKGVGRLNNGARVQIPPTPPRKTLAAHGSCGGLSLLQLQAPPDRKNCPAGLCFWSAAKNGPRRCAGRGSNFSHPCRRVRHGTPWGRSGSNGGPAGRR